MSLSSQNKKNKRKRRLKYCISFSQFINMKNIHKHEEHKSRKLIQIKSSNTIKVQTTDLLKYNPKTQAYIWWNLKTNEFKPRHIFETLISNLDIYFRDFSNPKKLNSNQPLHRSQTFINFFFFFFWVSKIYKLPWQ